MSNSSAKISVKLLFPGTERLLQRDLLADKEDAATGMRTDVDRFFYLRDGEGYLRAPVSYLHKLALAAAMEDDLPFRSRLILEDDWEFIGNYLNENAPPETYSTP